MSKRSLVQSKLTHSLCGKKSYLDKIKIMQKIKRPYPTVCLEVFHAPFLEFHPDLNC
jgi:hypothetical protein